MTSSELPPTSSSVDLGCSGLLYRNPQHHPRSESGSSEFHAINSRWNIGERVPAAAVGVFGKLHAIVRLCCHRGFRNYRAGRIGHDAADSAMPSGSGRFFGSGNNPNVFAALFGDHATELGHLNHAVGIVFWAVADHLDVRQLLRNRSYLGSPPRRLAIDRDVLGADTVPITAARAERKTVGMAPRVEQSLGSQLCSLQNGFEFVDTLGELSRLCKVLGQRALQVAGLLLEVVDR